MVIQMNEVNTFLMMGRPGSGKGTQAKLLATKIGADIYSSGNRLREMARGQGFVAQKIKRVMEDGELLPAWFSSHLFVDALLSREPHEAIVFEGACRREEEARDFGQTAEWLERPYRAIFFTISDAEVERRLAERRKVQGRADDASDTVSERLREYEEHTAKAVEFFRSQNMLIEINGEQPVEAVHADVLKALERL
jgi:adenylate kinase